MSGLGVSFAGMSATTQYRLLQGESGKNIRSVYEENPQVQLTVERFRDELATVKTTDDVTENFTIREFIKQAFGLEQLEGQDALLNKVLTEPVNDPRSLANRLNDPRFQLVAQTLRLDLGVEQLQDPAVVDDIVDRYLQNGYEIQQGESNGAVRQALYFERIASDVENIFQLYADQTLREVVRVVGRLPEQISQLDFEDQIRRYEAAIDVERLSDPEYIDSLVRDFLIINDTNNPVNSIDAQIAAMIQPISSGGTQSGIQTVNVNLVV